MLSLVNFLNVLVKPQTVISFVGGGGKTSAIFAVAAFFSKKDYKVAITTTTHIMDPRHEENRLFNRVITDFKFTQTKGISVLGSEVTQENKLTALSFEKINQLKLQFDLVLVEADGAKRRPVKAPAYHEPVIPDCSDIVIGVIGLDCLEKANDANNVHRPDFFFNVAGCQEGTKIKPEHLISLIKHKNGLFKNAPSSASLVVFFNKAELLHADMCKDLLYKLQDASLPFPFFF